MAILLQLLYSYMKSQLCSNKTFSLRTFQLLASYSFYLLSYIFLYYSYIASYSNIVLVCTQCMQSIQLTILIFQLDSYYFVFCSQLAKHVANQLYMCSYGCFNSYISCIGAGSLHSPCPSYLGQTKKIKRFDQATIASYIRITHNIQLASSIAIASQLHPYTCICASAVSVSCYITVLLIEYLDNESVHNSLLCSSFIRAPGPCLVFSLACIPARCMHIPDRQAAVRGPL